MKEEKCVVLNDKRQIILNDESDIFLSIISDGETKGTFPVSYPSAGYGGGSLLLSLSEQYLLFSYFSGQSEEAFILFKIDGCHLEPVYDSGYSYGECASYRFSSDEEFLLQTMRIDWWYKENAEIDGDGNQFYKFGAISMLNIKEKTLNKHIIHVYPSSDWEEEVTDNGLFQLSETENDGKLSLTMPWGKETFEFPLKDTIVCKPKVIAHTNI